MNPSTLQLKETYKNKRVLVTGHTGFKGSWLCEWLLKMGAEVYGLALEPNTEPNLFTQLDLAKRIDHKIGDIREHQTVVDRMLEVQPDFVFHLAAQPLVRRSYKEPVETFEVNVMGTIHVLDALRVYAEELKRESVEQLKGSKVEKSEESHQPLNPSTHQPKFCAAVFITTDKCYENREWLHGYREEDPMGGYDPYSASKGCAELAIAAYRRSFFSDSSPIRIASARAGNVIGGGDWAEDRIVPDMVRALAAGTPVPVRNKTATRPWQHVLEPLSGYLLLASRMVEQLNGSKVEGSENSGNLSTHQPINPSTSPHQPINPSTPQPFNYCSAFNFGPFLASNRTVADLVQEGLRHWPGEWTDCSDPNAVHEAGKLNLATDKAFHTLGWQPRWDFETTIEKTIHWYKSAHEGAYVRELVDADLVVYTGS